MIFGGGLIFLMILFGCMYIVMLFFSVLYLLLLWFNLVVFKKKVDVRVWRIGFMLDILL